MNGWLHDLGVTLIGAGLIAAVLCSPALPRGLRCPGDAARYWAGMAAAAVGATIVFPRQAWRALQWIAGEMVSFWNGDGFPLRWLADVQQIGVDGSIALAAWRISIAATTVLWLWVGYCMLRKRLAAGQRRARIDTGADR